MTQPIVVVTALASALAAATSGVLQHRSARTAPPEHGAGRLLGHLLTRPLWIAGLFAGGVGLVLHAAALSGGRLVLVQPLLVCGVLFALPVSVVLSGRRPSWVEWLWALVLVIGLAAFLVAGHPSAGRVSIDADVLAIASAAGCLLAALIALVAIRWPHGHGAALLGIAAGVGYGVTAALLKQVATAAGKGIFPAMMQWPFFALIAVGAGTIALTQLAYRAGPLAGSMPAVTISDPAASVGIGAFAFREHLAHTPVALTVEIVGFLLMFGATAELARRNQESPQ
jgi:drug/metabolite transporter (DMT)-like permease